MAHRPPEVAPFATICTLGTGQYLRTNEAACCAHQPFTHMTQPHHYTTFNLLIPSYFISSRSISYHLISASFISLHHIQNRKDRTKSNQAKQNQCKQNNPSSNTLYRTRQVKATGQADYSYVKHLSRPSSARPSRYSQTRQPNQTATRRKQYISNKQNRYMQPSYFQHSGQGSQAGSSPASNTGQAKQPNQRPQATSICYTTLSKACNIAEPAHRMQDIGTWSQDRPRLERFLRSTMLCA